MQRIRLLQIGTFPSSVIDNLAVQLSRLQGTYDFVFEDEALKPDATAALPDGTYPTKYLEQLIADFMHERRYSDHPVAITDLPLPEQLATSSDDRSAVISIYEAETYCRYSRIKLLTYLMAGILADLQVTTEAHYTTFGCPNDFCDDRKDINLGMARAEFCDTCKRTFLAALETGRMTQAQLTAINRILDSVGERKICFVLMPFRDKFTDPYHAIRHAVESAGYTCLRADEIFETKSIIQIIYDLIDRAEVVVADLTDRNPNVFYELGYAHALGKSTILVTQSPADVPFDLRHRQYVHYDIGDLAATLESRVRSYFPKAPASAPAAP
jgi:hypothetical protein